MRFDYFYGMQAEQFAFYQLPVRLVKDPEFAVLAMDAKVLYSMMLARNALSVRNGWIDSRGRVFIIYSVKEIMSDLGCANQKAAKLLAELEQAELIVRKFQGRGNPARIYVMNFSTGMDQQLFQPKPEFPDGASDRTRQELAGNPSNGPPVKECENHMPGDVKTTCLEMWKSHAKYKERYIKNQIKPSSEEVRQILLADLEAEMLMGRERELYEDIVSLVFETLEGRSCGTRLRGREVPQTELKEVLSGITGRHVLKTMQILSSEDPDEIRCKDVFILAVLFEVCSGNRNMYPGWQYKPKPTGFSIIQNHGPRTDYEAFEKKLIMDYLQKK